jgi:hypothetical protein
MLRAVWIVSVAAVFSGCVTYLDNPPQRHVSGRVLRAADGTPIAGARVSFISGRKTFSLLPVDTFGIDAVATTDADGRFAVSARLNDKVRVIVQDDQLIGDFQLPPFPRSNQIEGVVWKLSRHKPEIPQRNR